MQIDLTAIVVLVVLLWLGSNVIARLKRIESRINWIQRRQEHGLAALGVDPADSPPARAVRDLVAVGKKLDAVRLWRDYSGASLQEAKAYVDSLAAGREAGA